MKHLIMGLFLLFSCNAFTQEHTLTLEDKLKKEMDDMTNVMSLTTEQVTKLQNVRTEMLFSEMRITSAQKKGTPGFEAEWLKHMNWYNAKTKSLVTQEQWDAWINYYYSNITLNEKLKKRVETEMATMTEVMEMSEKQTDKMLKAKTAEARDQIRIIETVKAGTPEMEEALKNHTKRFTTKAKATVTSEQWYTWITHTANDQYLDEELRKELRKEMVEMKEVMGLSEKQEHKMTKIKSVQAFAAMEIKNTYEQGSKEMEAAWQDYGEKFRAKAKSAVSKDQWNLWLGFTCASCNKRKYSEEDKEAIRTKELNSQLIRAEETIAEMVKVMSLYPEQEDAIREIKLKLVEEIVQVYVSTEDGPERYSQINTLTQESNLAMVEATSHEQMDSWWYYWESQQEK